MFNPKPHNDPDFSIPRQCIWLKLNGSWPLQTQSTTENGLRSRFSTHPFGFFYSAWSWYVIISVGITIYFQTAFLIHTFGDIIMTTENCCTTFMGALNFVRLLHLHVKRVQFKDIIAHFVKEIWIVKNTFPHIERECEKNMNTFRIMTILLACLILMYCILPLMELFSGGLDAPEKPFPYKMLFPYDAHHGWRYVVTYLFTSYAGLCVVTTLFAEDSIFGFFITYTCGQFRILQERIDAIVPLAHQYVVDHVGNDQNARNWHFQRECSRQLKQIAFRHNSLIQFAKRLEDFFSPIMLVNFSISSVLICMVGFQLVTGKDMFIGDYVKFIVYISSSLSQLFILCWNGDKLIQYSTDIARHLYFCNWEGDLIPEDTDPDSGEIRFVDVVKNVHKLGRNNWQRLRLYGINRRLQNVYYYPTDKEFRSNLQFMIMCSQRPVRITALKFSTLSLQSFTAILSTSMSYFTLLQSVYKDQNN